jgi:hypothetical protein
MTVLLEVLLASLLPHLLLQIGSNAVHQPPPVQLTLRDCGDRPHLLTANPSLCQPASYSGATSAPGGLPLRFASVSQCTGEPCSSTLHVQELKVDTWCTLYRAAAGSWVEAVVAPPSTPGCSSPSCCPPVESSCPPSCCMCVSPLSAVASRGSAVSSCAHLMPVLG